MSTKIVIKTTDRVVPMIYAYTTPEIARHNGWTKIGYTEQDVDKRLSQQTHTADVEYKEEWRGNATFEDGSGDTFTDKDFHRYLRKLNIENDPKNEWFHVTGPVSRNHFYDFRTNRGILQSLTAATPYNLREEQEDAVEKTLDYSRLHTKGEYLWNAKPRFGKTLTAYELCKQMDADTVLIVTNRPAIANSWYSDYEKFLGPDSGYLFVSDTSSLQGKPFVVSRNQYLDMLNNGDYKCIEFVSLQDLKGSIYFGGEFEKLKEVNDIHWDVLIIDEAHEGVDTYKTDVAFDHIDRNFTLHLSGTPFKAIASEKFKEDAIYNWTYADEQKKKRDWQGDQSEQNPYANLPQLNMFTYQMSEVVRDELKQGIEINGETEEWAFDLNEFFAVNQAGNFVHDSAVDKFLDALTTQTKFPFSTPELRDELKHTLWLLNRVDSAKALARKLNNHPVFKDYKVVAAVGDGRLNDDDSAKKAFDSVTEAIAQNDKTITLSVGQLTTGVTIPEWTAVLMLSSIKSASLYMQAAFRAQNPCLFRDKGKFYRKENAYIFDFDPARTLMIFEEFANDLYASTSDGRGDTETRKKHIKELLNFFPVIGEDEDGEMVELDAEKVLSIPRKIRSTEVVNRGFMLETLYRNTHGIIDQLVGLCMYLNLDYISSKSRPTIDADYINKVAKRHYRGIQKLMDELDDPLNEKKRQKIIEEADRKLDNLLQEHKQTAFAEKIMESAEADEKKIPLKKNIIHNIEMVVADYTSDRIAAAVDRVLISTDETDEKVLTRVVMKLLTDSKKETPTKKQKSKKKPLQTSDMVKFIIE